MLKLSKDGEEVYWDKAVDLGVMGRFDSIAIDLYGCEVAGVNDDMPEEEKFSKISKYYGDRFKELESDVNSKVCGGMLLCATYGTIYENNKLEVTHNC